MAVAPTGAIYKSLIFDGEDSRDYGVYITGEAVYNAPERDVEMIAIPGRNGAFALDKGRFENIEVSYPAGIFADNETDFAEAISDFRNVLCSRKGYVRLEDEYNPNEYRMAVYKSGLEVSPTQLMTGEFEIIFECKPQRWLKSGETAITVTSNDTITNPTLFESSPLLEVEGYGHVAFNGYNVHISNAMMGNVRILDKAALNFESYDPDTETVVLKTETIPVSAYANNGDSFNATTDIKVQELAPGNILSASITTQPSTATASITTSGNTFTLTVKNAVLSGSIGTNASSSDSCVITGTYKLLQQTYSFTENISISIDYDSVTNEITVTVVSLGAPWLTENSVQGTASFDVDSTIPILGHPTYVDCDLGEAYRVDNDTVVSLNAYIDLGSILPTLAPGSNAITYDNTITDLKVTPRWWKV